MLYCTNCGNKNELDSSFCNLCGTKINVTSSSHQSSLDQTTTYEHKNTENIPPLSQPSQAQPPSMQNVSTPSQSTIPPSPHSQSTMYPTPHSQPPMYPNSAYSASNPSYQYPAQPNTFQNTGYGVPSSTFTAAVILNWVVVAFFVIFSLFGFLFGSYLLLTFIILSIPLAWAGYAVKNHNKNARIVLIVLHSILCVLYLALFPLSLIGLFISIFILYVFTLDKSVTKLFKEKAP